MGMDLNEIEKHAKALMTLHGVGYLAFRFDNGRRRIACTHYYSAKNEAGREIVVTDRITFSRHYAAILQPDEMWQVMLHEIAHVKAGQEAGHGPVFKREARKLGIPTERCFTTSQRPKGNVEAYCPVCEKVIADGHRLPLRLKWCMKCIEAGRIPSTPGAGRSSGHLLKWFKHGTRVQTGQMPARYREEYNAKRYKEREFAS